MNETPRWEPEIEDVLSGGPGGAETPRMGAFARIVQVFVNPVEVFRDIARKPTWAAVLLLTMLLSAGTQFAVLPHLDMEATIRQSLERSGREVPEEQMDRMIANASKVAWIGPVAAVVMVPVIMSILAGLYLLGLRLAGSDTSFVHTFSATLHAYWPASVAKAAILVALVSRTGKIAAEEMQFLVKSNLGAFLSAEAPRWQVALGSVVDVFNVWTFVLLVLGLSIVGGVSRKKAGVVAGVLWLVYVAGKVGLAVLKG